MTDEQRPCPELRFFISYDATSGVITTAPSGLSVWCHRCQRPVDELRIVQKPFECSRTYVAYCHGEQDVCKVPDSFFIANGDLMVVRVEAFRDKYLPEAP